MSWCYDVDGVLHASTRMTTVSIVMLPYVATWAFSSAVNERYWPFSFASLHGLTVVTEDCVDRSQGPYQWEAGSEREP